MSFKSSVFVPTVRLTARHLRLGAILPISLALRLYGGTDKAAHGYHRHYARLLGEFRRRKFTFFEIGVSRGDSLRAWRDMFPFADVVGLDIEPPAISLGRRVRIVQGDQANDGDLMRALEGFEPPLVVIDDGSHRGPETIASFKYLFSRMPSGGLYIVEDILTSYWRNFGGMIPAPENSAIGLARTLMEDIQGGAPVRALSRWIDGENEVPPAPETVFAGASELFVGPNFFAVRRD